jgi:UDP-N-acetylglucosamine--N-acetylmuramyl-(pentapeptide) pyrophosphoryl-undecaprenol N-acetylglucosamine transferase
MKVLFACAGTGGHLLPAVTIARGLLGKEDNSDVLFCLSSDERGADFLEREGFPWVTIPAKPFPRLIDVGSLLFPITVVRGIRRSLTVISDFDPQVVVGTGGYVSGPVLLAAWLKGIPVILQEQNSLPGLTNRLLAPLVDEIHMSFPEAVNLSFAKREKIFLTGNPVAFNGNSAAGVVRRERPGDPPVLLIMGGSQGAHSINRIMVQYLRSLDSLPFSILFQTGERDYSWVCASLEDPFPGLVVKSFFDDLPSRYREIDLVVCRAGAMTLSEIAFWGIPSILIPYPYAADNHQAKNAMYYEQSGAAIAVSEQEADWKVLKGNIEKVLGDPDLWNRMSKAAFTLRRPEATDILVERIIALGKREN